MRILYAVQATGQGHISRARAMAAALADYPVEVTWLFSGRRREKLFDMAPFGDFQWRRGLTFSTAAGRIQPLRTIMENNLPQLLRDVRELDLAAYDRVVTDYEPVSAWAARSQGVQIIGIGHQYAFGPGTPVTGANLVSRAIMRHFASVDVPLGLHWHPYAANVLPPILDLPELARTEGEHILVYLPFEEQDSVTALLRQFTGTRFVQYANGLHYEEAGNVIRHPASTATFKRHLADSAGVICNSGFELISECLQWRKPVLTKPLAGQMEQLSNALALQQLGYAVVAPGLSEQSVGDWLARPRRPPVDGFPDTAATLAHWLASNCRATPLELAQSLWGPAFPTALLSPVKLPRGSFQPG